MIRRTIAFVLVTAALCLVSIGRAPAAPPLGNRSGAWDVIVRVASCPKGFLCHFGYGLVTYVEPNYGQALKLARELTAEGLPVVAVEPAS